MDSNVLPSGPLSSGAEGEIATYKRRWLVLALFGLCTAVNAILWITFSPINSLTRAYYGINAAQVNALSIVFLASYVPFSYVSSVVFNKFGIRKGMLLACLLNLLSGLVRFLSAESNDKPRGDGNTGFIILLVGQTLGAIAQPFFTNLPTTIGATWFSSEQRDLGVVIGALCNPIGIAIGSVIPTFFIVGDSVSVNMFDLLLTELIITAVALVLVVAFFYDKPPLPPSISEVNKEQNSLSVDLKALFTNKHFNILFVCFGTGLGFFNALTTLIEQLVEPSGYSSDDASLFSGLLIGCGLIAAIVVGFLLDKYGHYNRWLKAGFIAASILALAMVLLIRPNNIAGLSIVFGLLGAVMLPLLPVTFECGVECTYPISEDLSTGALMSAGQVTGIAFIFILGELLDKQPTYTTYVFEPTYIIIVVVVAFACLGIQFYNGPYLRMEAETESSERMHDSMQA